MAGSLLSPLKVDECRSRLQEAGKADTVACRVRGRSFILQMKDRSSTAFLRGELSEDPAGTIVTYSADVDASTGQFASLWLKVGLPIFGLFTVALFLNGYFNGFTHNLSFALFLAVFVPVVYSVLRLREVRRTRRAQKEMLAFLQAALKGKSG